MKIYARFRTFVQVLFVLPFLVTGCGGTGAGYDGAPWITLGNNGVVTKDPNRLPDLAWQTEDQRQDLSHSNQQPAPAPVVSAPVVQKQRRVIAAILLPLTGKNAELGQSMLKAAQMALFDVGSTNVDIKPIDTKGDITTAGDAARQAIASGAEVILGPVFADDLKAARAATAGSGVPILSFSTDWAQAGGDTYVMGFMPFAQISRVAGYARAHGTTRFAALAPQTEYSDVVLGTLKRLGIEASPTLRYAPGQSDLAPLAADLQKSDFDALVLPLGGEGLRSLASLLNTQGVSADKVRFIGTGLWDDPTLLSTPSLYGGWYAAPDPKLRANFEKRYIENYDAPPARLASLAYDATALAAVLAHSANAESKPYTRERLTAPRGFAGIDGIFRLRGDNLAERGLAVLEIAPGGAKIIDPAPTAFSVSGS